MISMSYFNLFSYACCSNCNNLNYKIDSANRGDSLDHIIDEENRQTKDFLILVSSKKRKKVQ